MRATSRSADMPTPWLAGVCSGLSVHLGVPVRSVRLAMAALTALFGAGILLYGWLLVTVPLDGSPAGDGVRLARRIRPTGADRRWTTSRNQLLVAGVGIVALAVVLVALTLTDAVGGRDLVAILGILLGLGLVWSQASRIGELRTPVVVLLVGCGVLLLIGSLVLLASRGDSPAVLSRGMLIGAVVVVGVLVALAPLWLRTSSDLTAAKEQQVRDAERAEIAAHLHDSVLQTLTLVRGAADDPSRVRALALAQERQLRSWLYTGREQASDSLAEAVREAVGQVEATYGVAVDVVTVGDAVPGPAELALVAATGEAVTNAVRHATPPVTVYVEVGEDAVEVFVKDAGPGFDPEAIPADRHGVRNSIIGRLERAGGGAWIRRLSPGTEVHMIAPRTAPGRDAGPASSVAGGSATHDMPGPGGAPSTGGGPVPDGAWSTGAGPVPLTIPVPLTLPVPLTIPVPGPAGAPDAHGTDPKEQQ